MAAPEGCNSKNIPPPSILAPLELTQRSDNIEPRVKDKIALSTTVREIFDAPVPYAQKSISEGHRVVKKENSLIFFTLAAKLSGQFKDFPYLERAIEKFNNVPSEENCKTLLKLLASLPLSTDKHNEKTIQDIKQELAKRINNKTFSDLCFADSLGQKLSPIAGSIFKDYPDIHTPRVKKRGFSTSNLTKESGFVIKFFKYAAQISRRYSDDKYSGLRHAVARFNTEKSEAALDHVMKHINLLKSEECADFNDETIVQIANEVILAKIQMISEMDSSKIGFSNKMAKKIQSNTITYQRIRTAVENYNNDYSSIHAKNLLKELFDWMKKDRTAFAQYLPEVHEILYAIGGTVQDPQLHELFGMLSVEKTLIAYKKIAELEKSAQTNIKEIFLNKKDFIHISQVNIRFTHFRNKELKTLRAAIKTFNLQKNGVNFNQVLIALKKWQYTHDHQFNGSNGLKIMTEMHDILNGATLQDRIKKSDSYTFSTSFKTIQQNLLQSPNPQSKWDTKNWDVTKWNPLIIPYRRKHMPSPSMQAVVSAVTEFNRQRKLGDRSKALSELYQIIDAWIQEAPDEFNQCGGERLLNGIKKNILSSVTSHSVNQLKQSEKSSDYEGVKHAIINYNMKPSVNGLINVHEALKDWKKNQSNKIIGKEVEIGEFHRYHGEILTIQINGLLIKAETAAEAIEVTKQKTKNPQVVKRDLIGLPTLLLPDSHPPKVFERSLAMTEQADGGQNAYLMIFHNPIAPWSHSDIGFVSGAAEVSAQSFVEKTLTPDLQKYFHDGLLIKNIPFKDFPKHRPFLNDFERYIAGPNRKLMDREQAHFIPCNIDGTNAWIVFNFMKSEGFLDANGRVQAKYFTHGTDEYFKDKGKFSPDVIAAIRLAMPDPMIPKLLEKQIDIAKSEEAFEFLKQNQYLKEDNILDPRYLYKGSPLFKAIENYFKGDDEFIEFFKEVLATPISRKFDSLSFQRGTFGEKEGADLFSFLKDKNLMVSKENPDKNEAFFLKSDWTTLLTNEMLEALPDSIKPYREAIVHKLQQCHVSGEVSKREYLGIGASPESLDSSSQHAEGVRLEDPRLVSRLQKLCKRRKNEIQRNMNVMAGAAGGARSLVQGGYASLLVSEKDRLRHIRQALIDNFLTSMDPQSFLPNLKENRYRLELYESGGEVYKKWIEDSQGQFSKVKNPSSQDISGEFMENEYRHNSYALVNGKLKSVKSGDKERLAGQEKGNVIQKGDGTKEWMPDAEFGQYFKPKGAGIEEAVIDDRPLYSAMNCEKYLANGESEWCGSCVIRLLHGAYAHEYMPEFQSILNSLKEDFVTSTSFTKDSQFEKQHAQMLFLLADQYSKKILKTDAAKKYFRDMNPTIRLSPRCTPDMIHKFLMGKSPGIVNNIKRSWKTIQMPDSRGQVVEGTSMKASVLAAETGLGILAIPTAVLKLVTNVISAITGTVIDVLVTAPQQAAQSKKEELARQQEASGTKKIKFQALKIAKTTIGTGLIKRGLIKRIGGDLIGVEDVIDSVKTLSSKKEHSAFA